MYEQLEKLLADVISYRNAVNQLFDTSHAHPRDWRELLGEILICSSQLYLDYLLIFKSLPELEAESTNGRRDIVRTDALRERDLRSKLKHQLESSHSWLQFRPESSYSELTRLHSLQDYFDRFVLHLPEIYEETFRVEALANDFIESNNGAALAQLVAALQHLGRNHIGFVLQPLELAADGDSWDAPIVNP